VGDPAVQDVDEYQPECQSECSEQRQSDAQVGQSDALPFAER
jgi:hypothetical protein